MNTLQQEQNEPKFAVDQIEDKVSGNSLRAWLKWNDEQQKKAVATARAEGAAEERNLFKEFVKRQFGFKHYKYDKNSIKTIIREYDSYLQALTTKEHHAS